MKLNKIHIFIIFLFGVLLLKWTKEKYQKTTPLNIHGVYDLKENNPSVFLRPLKNEKEPFNFFARDADIVLRGRYVDVTKMSPNLENRSELAMKSEENQIRLS